MECKACQKKVYDMEKLTTDNAVYHKWCFKCSKCNGTLRLGNFASLHGQVFCKPHFMELFKNKGNYDEGFGKEKHSKRWSQMPKTEAPPAEENKPTEEVVTEES